jgi:hypothetical protein
VIPDSVEGELHRDAASNTDDQHAAHTGTALVDEADPFARRVRALVEHFARIIAARDDRIAEQDRQLAARDEEIHDLKRRLGGAQEYASHEARERRYCPRCFNDLFG